MSGLSPRARSGQADVAVVGLGYVGLTLAVTFANAGTRVLGVDTAPSVVAAISSGTPPFYEPGLAETMSLLPSGTLTTAPDLPERLPPVVMICVGTPVDPVTRKPLLSAFTNAVQSIADRCDPGTLVIVRSTVPVGTTRAVALPRLAARVEHPLLAVCPERTIQGRAMAELRGLPQVIGGLDETSAERADALFEPLVASRVIVSTLEAAEMVKLVNNVHTDIIYGFGNEVALMTSALGLDADEIIDAANAGYPRPDLSRPGFVGGSCLTKDPYLLLSSVAPHGLRPGLTTAARSLNEAVPRHVVDLVSTALRRAGTPLSSAKVLVCGIAYKGRPQTDDVRGAASVEIARMLRGTVATLAGHDFLAPPDKIKSLGYEPMSLYDGLDNADALILLTDHPGYAGLDAAAAAARMRRPVIVADVWGVARAGFENADHVTYLRWGRG